MSREPPVFPKTTLSGEPRLDVPYCSQINVRAIIGAYRRFEVLIMSHSVARLCHQHQLSLEQLSERTGLDRSRLTAIVMGRWTPSPKDREAIAQAFGISKDEIAWGHATPIQHLYGHGPG